MLRGEEAEDFAERLRLVLNNVKYNNTETVNIGVWKTKIVLYNSTDTLELYIDGEGIYIENKGRLIRYGFDGGSDSCHQELLSEIEKYKE